MGPLHISAVVLLCITVVWGMPMDDDACIKKCGNSKPCEELDDKPTKSVDRCLNFIYNKCSKSNDRQKCINSQADTRRGGCTKSILESAIPCLKCEVDCEYSEYDYGDESDYATEQEKECFKQCDSSKACMAIEGISKVQRIRCEKYLEMMCRNGEDISACMERLKDTEDARCPKSIRNNMIACMKCENNCMDDDYVPDDESAEECYETCAATESCKIFERAPNKMIKDCKALSDKKCPDDPQNIETCLESIKDVSGIKCPKKFRKHVLACVKCYNSCAGQQSQSSPDGRRNFDEGEKCLISCQNTPSCTTFISASPERHEKCYTYIDRNCGGAQDVSACMDKLKDTPDAKCPVSFRNATSACRECDFNCQEKYGVSLLDEPTVQECQDDCSQTSACAAVDSASDEALEKCEDFFERTCGESEDAITCMESQQQMDESCPKEFRAKFVECFICDMRCEDSTADDGSAEECYEECSETQSCKTFDAASNKRINDCMALSEANCDDPEDMETCLESIQNISSNKCPKSFRSEVLTCVKCDSKCEGQPESRHSFEDSVEKCFIACDGTPECIAVDSASEETLKACRAFQEEKCGGAENVTACMDKHSDVPNAKCPPLFRSKVSVCMACENDCAAKHGEGTLIGPQEEACLQECSKRASCVVVDTAPDEAIGMCETLFREVCGDAEDAMACIEAYTEEDETCPISFRADVVDCMKCDRKCEEVPDDADGMTKAACESNCDATHGCKGGNIKPECKECLSAECSGIQDPDCIIRATIGTCLPKCFIPSEKEKKQVCDKCKADCASYP